jgi:hypothetical protein
MVIRFNPDLSGSHPGLIKHLDDIRKSHDNRIQVAKRRRELVGESVESEYRFILQFGRDNVLVGAWIAWLTWLTVPLLA